MADGIQKELDIRLLFVLVGTLIFNCVRCNHVLQLYAFVGLYMIMYGILYYLLSKCNMSLYFLVCNKNQNNFRIRFQIQVGWLNKNEKKTKRFLYSCSLKEKSYHSFQFNWAINIKFSILFSEIPLKTLDIKKRKITSQFCIQKLFLWLCRYNSPKLPTFSHKPIQSS